MSASGRVAAQINSREVELTAELESKLALKIAFPPLDEIRQKYSRAVEVREKISSLVVRHRERREQWLKRHRQPTGLGTLFSNSRRNWAAKLAAIDKKISELTERSDSARDTELRLKGLVSDFERQLRKKQHALANSAERGMRELLLVLLRHKVWNSAGS